MLDFMTWFTGIFFSIFNVLDDIKLIGELSLLKVLIIVFLFTSLITILSKGAKNGK